MIFLSLLLTATAAADSITLQDALRMLRDPARSPAAAASRARIAVAESESVAAEALPNPTLSYGGVFLASGESTGAARSHQVQIEQPLYLFGQRSARRAVAELLTSVERASVAEELEERAHEVRGAFGSLLAGQERVRILEGAGAEIEEIARLVRGRAEAGDKSRYDVVRIETEARVLGIQLEEARGAAADAAGKLAALLGRPGWRPVAAGPLAPAQLGGDVDALWREARHRRPSLVHAERRISAATAALEEAKVERLPVPAIAAGALITEDVGGVSAVVGLSLPVPVLDAGEGPIARALAERREAELVRDAALAAAHAELERAAVAAAHRRDTARRVRGELEQRLPELRAMAEAAYKQGRAEIVDLLDTVRTARDLRLAEVDQLEALKVAEADLIAAAGLDAGA